MGPRQRANIVLVKIVQSMSHHMTLGIALLKNQVVRVDKQHNNRLQNSVNITVPMNFQIAFNLVDYWHKIHHNIEKHTDAHQKVKHET